MYVHIRLTVERTVPVDSKDWEFPKDPNYVGVIAPVETVVPVVFLFKLPIPAEMSYPIVLAWARTQMNSLSTKYQAISARIDEDMLRDEFNEQRKIK